jgi:hypothetical protein
VSADGGGRGGAAVVVRGRESRSHGEGRQRACGARPEGEEIACEYRRVVRVVAAGGQRAGPLCDGVSPVSPKRAGKTFVRDSFIAVTAAVAYSCSADELVVAPVTRPASVRAHLQARAPRLPDSRAEADHILPGSKGGVGGPRQSCNGVRALQHCEVRPAARRDRLAASRSLDMRLGRTHGSVSPLWQRAGKPTPRYHLTWIAALAGTKH